MDVFTHFLSCIFIFIVSYTSIVFAQEPCVSKGPCKCEFANGTGIDLTPSMKSTFYKTQNFLNLSNTSDKDYVLATFVYHPCSDAIAPEYSDPKLNGTCNIALAICRQQTKMVQDGPGSYKVATPTYEFLGSSNFTNFTYYGGSLGIIYNNGPSTTTVVLKCGFGEEELHTLDLSDDRHIVLSFYSPNACLQQLELPGRSFGSTLCIVFFCIVIFYLVLGICTKKFLMGATGLEVIPNLGFWSDLPNLVKDGWAFSASGFKLPARGAPAASPDPNSYDSI